MKLLKEINVHNYRSIQHASLDNLGNFSILAGLNNSGKSNFLRALNAFFTGNIEDNIPLNIERDFYRPGLKSKKKKVIQVSVSFDLPPRFKFRTGLESVEKLLGRSFTIIKKWNRDSIIPSIYLNDDTRVLDPENQERVINFLALIAFRYIPNRVIPTEIVLKENQALRDVLIRKLARYKTQSKEVFDHINKTASALIENLANEINKIVPDITQVRLATASSLADLAFKFGYRLKEDTIEVQETEQGSGMQSLLMFQTLHLIDRDYFQNFGWKQASIWAVEEPESSLHTALEAQVARFLSRIANEKTGRLQIIATTHSDLMIQYSDTGYYVDKQKLPVSGGSNSTVVTPERMRGLIEKSARFGISRWVNPVLFYPLNPIILVEGKYDRDFILEALKVLGITYDYRIVCLEDLTQHKEKGGVETLKKFIKDNADVISIRPKDAPVLVVLDWDASKKKEEFDKLFKLPGAVSFKVLAWNETDCNPNLHKSFRGIERFYSDRIIEEAEGLEPKLIFTNSKGQKSVDGDESSRLKSILADIVKKGLTREDIKWAEIFIMKIDEMAKRN